MAVDEGSPSSSTVAQTVGGPVFNLAEHEARWPEILAPGSTGICARLLTLRGSARGFPKTQPKLGVTPGLGAAATRKSRRK
jgi:hypothetical protein